jgi:hypothetical protein
VTTSLFELKVEPAVARVACTWYARDVFALMAEPSGLPEQVLADLHTWARDGDENVRMRRPFLVEVVGRDRSSYVFAPDPSRRAPRWWLHAVRAWNERYGRDERGLKVRR